MNQKRKYKTYSKEFKEEAVSLVTDQGYSVAEAAEAVGVNPNQTYQFRERPRTFSARMDSEGGASRPLIDC